MVCFTPGRGRMIMMAYLCAGRLGIERCLDLGIDLEAGLARGEIRYPDDAPDLLDSGLVCPRACSLHVNSRISKPSVLIINSLIVIG
jgi:hypothetical protein